MQVFVFRDFQMENKLKPGHTSFKRNPFKPLQILKIVLVENTEFRSFSEGRKIPIKNEVYGH